jgi:hypothetical protein
MISNKNKKAKFNAIDVLIILLILACIASVVYKAFFAESVAPESDLEEYRIYFKVDDIKSTSVAYFVPGDNVRLTSNDESFGTLESIGQILLAVGAYNENGGEIYYPDVEDQTIYNDTRYSLTGYILVKGVITDKGFLLNGTTYIAPNTELEIVTQHLKTCIKIVSINAK